MVRGEKRKLVIESVREMVDCEKVHICMNEDINVYGSSDPFNRNKDYWRYACTVNQALDHHAKIAKKKYNIMFGVGQAKYVVNFHDGVKTHKDGSPFYDIALFSNKTVFNRFVKELEKQGYNKE